MDPRPSGHIKNLLPETIGGRIALFLIAVPVAAFTGWGIVINFLYGLPPSSAVGIACLGLMRAVLVSVCTVSSLGSVWALFKPESLRSYLSAATARAALLVFFAYFAFLVFAGVVWLLL